MKRGYVKFPKGMKVAIQSGPHCMRWSGVLFYQLVDIFLIAWQIGVCAIYFVFVSENVKQVTNNLLTIPSYLWPKLVSDINEYFVNRYSTFTV